MRKDQGFVGIQDQSLAFVHQISVRCDTGQEDMQVDLRLVVPCANGRSASASASRKSERFAGLFPGSAQRPWT
jgi:hypothetical protein